MDTGYDLTMAAREPEQTDSGLQSWGLRSMVLPEFDNPPVLEVALGVQFRTLYGLRTIELSGLREIWRSVYPHVQEQPPLPPALESSQPTLPAQFMLGPQPSRTWFLSGDSTELVQIQNDRLILNWRRVSGRPYPRYQQIRERFLERLHDFRSFLEVQQLGTLSFTQVELTYINGVDVGTDDVFWLGDLLRGAPRMAAELGSLEQARASWVFVVDGFGRAPVRLYVNAEPGQRPPLEAGQAPTPSLFLTLMTRGAPADDGIDTSVEFMDAAHEHTVRSFAELTTETMHERWGRTQ